MRDEHGCRIRYPFFKEAADRYLNQREIAAFRAMHQAIYGEPLQAQDWDGLTVYGCNQIVNRMNTNEEMVKKLRGYYVMKLLTGD